VRPLVAAFKDGDRDLRRYAAEALIKIGAPAVRPLVAAFKDGDRDLRRYAARSLGRIGDPRARKLLRAVKLDPDKSLRKVSAEGLARQALADKLLGVRIGMTGEALTGLVGRPAVTRSGAAPGVESTMAVSEEALEPERWLFQTEFGSFLVVMQRGLVTEVLTAGLLDRLRPAWRMQNT
jgi:HEAT repeat protein